MPQQKNTCPGGLEHYNFSRLFLGHHYCTLSLSDLLLGVEKKIFRRINAFSLYELYGYAPVREPLPRGPSNLQFWYTIPWSSLLNT